LSLDLSKNIDLLGAIMRENASCQSDVNTDSCIFSISPLTQEDTLRFKNKWGRPFTNLTFTNIRKLSLWKMLVTLRQCMPSELLLLCETENSACLKEVLLLCASMTRAKTLYRVENEAFAPVSRLSAIPALFHVIGASLLSMFALFKVAADVRHWLKIDRAASPVVSENKNIVYLNANLWFGVQAGGSVGHIAGVVNALAKGYAIHFLSVSKNEMLRSNVAFFPLEAPKYFGSPNICNYYRFHYAILRQARKMVKQKPRWIYQRLSTANYSGVVLAREWGVPLILEYNGSEVWVARNWGRPLMFQKIAEQVEAVNLRHAHRIVTVSEVLRDELIARGVEPERIVTYPNCVDPTLFDPARFSNVEKHTLRQQWQISHDACVFGFIGTFGQWHGVDVLAAAIRELIETRTEWLQSNKVHFLLIGDGLKMPVVKDILGQHATGSFVTLTGLVRQEQAPLYLSIADVLVSPHVPNADGSKFFGSPTKLFEYMCMGKAIIASDLEQIGSILQNAVRVDSLERCSNENAVACLVQPGNVKELALAIEKIVANLDLRCSLGKNARKLALDHYTWEHHVEAILEGF